MAACYVKIMLKTRVKRAAPSPLTALLSFLVALHLAHVTPESQSKVDSASDRARREQYRNLHPATFFGISNPRFFFGKAGPERLSAEDSQAVFTMTVGEPSYSVCEFRSSRREW